MKTVQQIEHAIITLTDDDFRTLYHWMIEMDHQKWDQQIAEDSERGLLDEFTNQAIREYRHGKTTPL
jgi:hypothetical protein